MDEEETDLKIRRNLFVFAVGVILISYLGIDGASLVSEVPVLKHAKNLGPIQIWGILAIAHTYLWLRYLTCDIGKSPLSNLHGAFKGNIVAFRGLAVQKAFRRAFDGRSQNRKAWVQIPPDVLDGIDQIRAQASKKGCVAMIHDGPHLSLTGPEVRTGYCFLSPYGQGTESQEFVGRVELGWILRAATYLSATINTAFASKGALERSVPHYMALAAVSCILKKLYQSLCL